MTCPCCGMDHEGVDWDAVDLASAQLEAARDEREMRVGMAGIRPLTVDGMFGGAQRPTLAEAARRLGPRVAVAVQAAAREQMAATVAEAKAQTPRWTAAEDAMRRWKGLS